MRLAPLEVEIKTEEYAAAGDGTGDYGRTSGSEGSALICDSVRFDERILLLQSQTSPAEHERIPAIRNRECVQVPYVA
jgi:hypothetical protein